MHQADIIVIKEELFYYSTCYFFEQQASISGHLHRIQIIILQIFDLNQEMSVKNKQEDQEAQQILQEQQKEKQIPSTALVYGQSPISMKCPYCLQHIRSEIIMKPQFISIALGMSIFAIVPNFIMILLVVALLQLTASRKHRCPLCERELGSDGIFLLYFTDEVISFTIFSAGFIFTKKLLVTCLLIVFTVLVLSIRLSITNSQKWVATTWPQYLQQCKQANPSVCLNKYRGKEFKDWSGHVMRMIDNRQLNHRWYLHAVSLFMKMSPDVTQDNQPDVLLTLNSDSVYSNSEMLRNVQHGDLIKFNCTLHQRQRGNFKDVMHFHVDSFEIIGHDAKYSMHTSPIEEQWIQIHVQNKGKLQTQAQNPQDIKPI